MFLHNFLRIKDSFYLIKLNNYPNLIKTLIIIILDNYFKIQLFCYSAKFHSY